MANKLGGPFIPVPKWTLEYLRGDSRALHVLVIALAYLNSDTQELTTSYEKIAEKTGYSRRTVIRAMNRLVEIGAIKKTLRTGVMGYSMTNRYVIDFNNPEAAISGGVSSDTGGSSGVSSDTPGVSAVTPLGVSAVTPNQERIKHIKKRTEKGLNLFSTDPKWERQRKKGSKHG